MIIVDDRLSLDALAGRLGGADTVATTWCFHYRLVRALSDSRVAGALSGAATATARAVAGDPPEARLVVLDPRRTTTRAAELANRYDLNLLAAELFAAAVEHRAEVRLSAANVGRRWPEVMTAEGIAFAII